MSEHATRPEPTRECGACSLCCSVLRVDELGKPAGRDCRHQRAQGGCAIHATRPAICRAYHCLWLQGGLEADDRPDRLGAVLDLQTVGVESRLSVQEARPGAFDASPRLQAIVEEFRTSMTVRMVEAGNEDDPDRPYRVWLPSGEHHRVEGEWRTVSAPGRAPRRQRLPWFERLARRVAIGLRRWRLARLNAEEHRP